MSDSMRPTRNDMPDETALRECAETLVQKWDAMPGVSERTYWAITDAINTLESWVDGKPVVSHLGFAAEKIIEGKDRLISAFREYAELEAQVEDFDCTHDADEGCDCGQLQHHLYQRAQKMREGLLAGTQPRKDRSNESPDSLQPSGPSAGAIKDGGSDECRERADVTVSTHRLHKQADKLRAVAEWFTDCKTLTLENMPVGLIDALRAGADALDQVGNASPSPEAKHEAATMSASAEKETIKPAPDPLRGHDAEPRLNPEGYCACCYHPLDRCGHCDGKDDRDRVYAAVHEEIMKLRVTLHNVLNGRSDIDNIVYHAQNRACAAALAALKVGSATQPLSEASTSAGRSESEKDQTFTQSALPVSEPSGVQVKDKNDDGASLLPADPSATVTTEPLLNIHTCQICGAECRC